jgi:hypothetical protein
MIVIMAVKNRYWQTAEQCMKKLAVAIRTDGPGKRETGTRYAWCGLTLKTGISAASTINLNKRLNFGSGDNYLDARRSQRRYHFIPLFFLFRGLSLQTFKYFIGKLKSWERA